MSFASGKLSLAACALALAACAVVPAGASALATDQVVTGTVIAASLAVGVPVAADFATGLGTAAPADTTLGTVALTAIGPWVARVSDAVNGGKLKSTTALPACAGSTSLLNNALRVFATAALGNFTPTGTTGSPLTMSGTAQQVASGIGSNVVTMTYRHIPDASDQLTAACTYTMASTIAIAAT